ncbi:MAG: phosphoribosylglycinamide synthetase C domain-containing protein, partial [Dehalococcoidia bacterium]
GKVISGLDRVPGDTLVFHAGTAINDAGQTVTAGGRVLAGVGRGGTVTAARKAAYAVVDAISFDGAEHRTDIAARAVVSATMRF